MAAGFALTVTNEGKQLKVQASGQDPFEIYPLSDNVFYIKAFVAQITFYKNEDSRVESLTLNQGGQEKVRSIKYVFQCYFPLYHILASCKYFLCFPMLHNVLQCGMKRIACCVALFILILN